MKMVSPLKKCSKRSVVCRILLNYINTRKETLNKPIYFEVENADGMVEIAMQWTTSYSTNSVLSFANNIHTIDGGTHLDGFKQGVTRTINDYARNKGILKDKDANLSGDDTREGLAAVISVKLRDPRSKVRRRASLVIPRSAVLSRARLRRDSLSILKRILLQRNASSIRHLKHSKLVKPLEKHVR